MSREVNANNVFTFNGDLEIVGGLELGISHVVIFKMHEDGIRVCFGDVKNQEQIQKLSRAFGQKGVRAKSWTVWSGQAKMDNKLGFLCFGKGHAKSCTNNGSQA